MITVKDQEIPWREGMTVADVLREVGDSYPYAVVRVNERSVSRPDFERVTVPKGAKIYPIPMIAGG